MSFKPLVLVAALAVFAPACVRTPTGAAPAEGPLRLPVTVTAPADGFVSMALYDKDGVLVRSLLYAQPVTAGRQTAWWDGSTDLGKPAPAGTYTAKGLFFATPPSLNYQMIVGRSGNPPWRTTDGKGDWGGNLGPGTSIVSTGKRVILGIACVEDNQITGIQQMDPDGNIQMRYYSFYPWDVRMAAAADESNYYLGIMNGGKKQLEIAQYKIGEPRGKILVELPTPPHYDQTDTRWNGRWQAWLDGLALSGDTLYATVALDNALFIIDRATGRIRKQVSLPSPRGIAVSGNRVLVVSGNQVLFLTREGQIESTVVPEGVLTAANAIAVDSEGRFYVGDSGAAAAGPESAKGTRQVLVFSPAGKLLSRIGVPGGSPMEGKFLETGFGVISSLCIAPGPAGSGEALWVNDVATGFFRTSRWTLSGKLDRQWFTRRLSLYSDGVNPARPNELVYTSDAFSDEPGITAYEMDIGKKTWRPSWHYAATWDDMYQEDLFLSFMHGGNPLSKPDKPRRWPVFDYNSRTFITYKGRHYFMNRSGNGDGSIFVYGPDSKPKPVAMVSYHRTVKRPDGKLEGIYDQGPNNWFTWADRDGDGRMTAAEIIFTAAPASLTNTPRVNEGRLDANLNVLMKRFVVNGGKPSLIDSMLPLKELLPNGVPVYDWSDLRDLVPLQAPDLTGGDGTKEIRMCDLPLPIETADAYYSMVSPSSMKPMILPGIDGQGWWAGRNWRTKVARFDKLTGKPVWAVGRRAPGLAQPGQMYHPAALAGVAGGAVFVTDTLGPVWVWNDDGLYIGQLYNYGGAGIADDKTLYGEIQATGILTDPNTGKIYSIANDTGAHIHEVILPARKSLVGAKVTLTEAQVARVQPWDPDGVAPTEKPTFQAAYVAVPPAIDGVIDGREGWYGTNEAKLPEALILMDGLRLAGLRALYDGTNLYLAYDVTATNGSLNAGSELPYSPFVSGAYVDFNIAPVWQGPRSEVREGDVRVLVAQITDPAGLKLFQQGFWQKKTGGVNPRTISSPAASVTFDQIMEVPGLKAACKAGGTDARTGLTQYTVELSVPLASMGLTNVTGKTIGFDASVGVANAAGDRRDRAAHWAGASEAFVVDRPGSTRLIPDTWGTLTFGARKAAGTKP